MNENPEHSIEHVTAEFLSETWICRKEVCSCLGIGEDMLEMCLQWEIIQSPQRNEQGEDLYPVHDVDRLGRAVRLHRDLGLNWPGVSVALELLDRIEELERRG